MKYEYFSKQILKDKSLTDATKVVASYLIHIAGWENDNILPSMNTLSDLVSVNKSQVVIAINQLKEKDRDKALLVINYLNNNSSITSIEASSLLNVSESTCRRLLLKCESLGLLYSTGQTRNRRYYLTTKGL